MSSRKKHAVSLAAIVAAAIVLGGCAGDDAPSPDAAASGEPVSGGVLRVAELAAPTGFDPAQVFSSTSMPISLTGLYGQFVSGDPETGEYTCVLCEDFSTDDGGSTYTVVTREGLTFTDGTPFDAEAIKYNWDRLKEPALGSASAGIASQIDRIEIVDDRTARLVMVEQTPNFPATVSIYSLQWIASPTALEKGQEEFNRNPVGAGPFVFESWTPNGALKLTRNPDYFDAPKPYLDGLEVTGVVDNAQRLNALITGQVDLALNAEAATFAEAESAGFSSVTYTFNGGVGFMLNTSAAPFDDVRARQALSYALDLDGLSDAITRGYPSAPETLFQEESAFYEDIPLQTHDPERAQELFDELAAEGKPVDFSYALFPGAQTVFDALQAQLSAYDNVTVTADSRDTSEQGVVGTTGDYDLLSSSLAFADAGSRLWASLHGDANRTNYSRIDDAELNAALDAARDAADVGAQKAQYRLVQERLAEVVPYILYQSYEVGAITSDDVHGVSVYGYTTPAADGIWLTS